MAQIGVKGPQVVSLIGAELQLEPNAAFKIGDRVDHEGIQFYPNYTRGRT